MSQRPLLRKMITMLSMTNKHSFPHDSIRKLRRSIQISIFCEQLLRKAIGQSAEKEEVNTLYEKPQRDGSVTHEGEFGNKAQFQVSFRPANEDGDEWKGGEKHPYLMWAGRKNWNSLPAGMEDGKKRQRFHEVLPHIFHELFRHGYRGSNLTFDVLNPGTKGGDWRNDYFNDVAHKWSSYIWDKWHRHGQQLPLPLQMKSFRKAIGQEVRRTLGRDLKDEAARASLETRRGNTFYRTNTRDEDGFYDEDEPPAFHGVFGPDKSMYVQIHSSPRLSVPNYHRGLLTENGLEYGQDDIAEPGDHFEVGWVHTRPGGKASMLDPEWKRHFFAALHKIGAGSIGFVPLNGAGNVQRKILFQRIANDFHKQTSGVTPADNHPRLTREEHYFGMNR